MIVQNQDTVVDMLKDPATYGDAGPVETIETHISRIFLVGQRAFKMKRAVKLLMSIFRRRNCGSPRAKRKWS